MLLKSVNSEYTVRTSLESKKRKMKQTHRNNGLVELIQDLRKLDLDIRHLSFSPLRLGGERTGVVLDGKSIFTSGFVDEDERPGYLPVVQLVLGDRTTQQEEIVRRCRKK